jgi:hypothetical protein
VPVRQANHIAVQGDVLQHIDLLQHILIVGGALILIEGVQAMRSGELVNIGGFRTGFRAPWWKAVPFGMPVVVLGIWTAWPDSKRS